MILLMKVLKEKKSIYILIFESFFCKAETITLYIKYVPVKKKNINMKKPTYIHNFGYRSRTVPLSTVRSNSQSQTWNNKHGSKLGKEYIKAVHDHPAYLTYMQSTKCEVWGWTKQKLELRLPGETSITSDVQVTPPLWQKARRGTKESLDESERGQ